MTSPLPSPCGLWTHSCSHLLSQLNQSKLTFPCCRLKCQPCWSTFSWSWLSCTRLDHSYTALWPQSFQSHLQHSLWCLGWSLWCCFWFSFLPLKLHVHRIHKNYFHCLLLLVVFLIHFCIKMSHSSCNHLEDSLSLQHWSLHQLSLQLSPFQRSSLEHTWICF